MMELDEIFTKLRARIVAWATSSRWAQAMDPEDLAQEVLLELRRRYPDIHDLEDLVPLSFRILDFKIRNEVRKRIRRKEDQQMSVEDLLLEHPGSTPEEHVISHQRLKLLGLAASRLRPKYRQLLRLQLEHRSLKEISQLLGEPEGTIHSRWSRCRQALRKELGKLLEKREES